LRFTVRSPAQRLEGSPCCHRPSGGDVTCGVDISVTAEPAGDAPEHRLALAVVRHDMPTRRAPLRRVRGFDLLHPSGSFVLQPGQQSAPAVGENTPIQPRFLSNIPARPVNGSLGRAGHASNVEVFHPDQVEPAGQIGRSLFHPIPAPIALAGTEPCDRRLDSLAPVRPALAACEFAVQAVLPSSLVRCQAGCAQKASGRQGGRHCDTQIHSNGLAVARCGDRVGDIGERDMPPACSIPGYPIRLDPVRYGARPSETDPPHLGHPHPAVSAIEPEYVLGLHADLPESFIVARLAPRRAAVGSTKEVPHGLGKVSQCLLLHRHTARLQPLKLRPCLGQLTRLLAKARRCSAVRPPMAMLFTCQVPHEPSVRTMLQQRGLLIRRERQPVAMRHKMDASGRHRQNQAEPSRIGVSGFLPMSEGVALRRLESGMTEK
jgi:hypothetical protein